MAFLRHWIDSISILTLIYYNLNKLNTVVFIVFKCFYNLLKILVVEVLLTREKIICPYFLEAFLAPNEIKSLKE